MDRFSSNTERGSVGSFFLRLLATLLILALSAAVVYLMSERNQSRYRLRVVENQVVVERGRFLPLGFEAFSGEGELSAAYAPIDLPDDISFTPPSAFLDRVDLDRAMFSILSGWVNRLVDAQDHDRGDQLELYVQRIELLPGISEEQRSELRILRADAAYHSAEAKLAEVERLLNDAEALFLKAIELNSSRRDVAAQRLLELDTRNSPKMTTPPPAQELVPSPNVAPSESEPKPEPPDELQDETKAPKKSWRL